LLSAQAARLARTLKDEAAAADAEAAL
jgi:hypothetical protein